MDDQAGSPGPDVNRLHADDAASPSRSPPLLQSVSGNDSSSAGSPGGSHRHGSTGEKDRKERVRLMKERQLREDLKRLDEWRAAQEKERLVRQAKDLERLRRISEIKMRELQRRQAFEERRRRLDTEDKEKREQILAKYKEYETRSAGQRDQKKPVFAFGSSTPRTLAYLEHLENSMRVYNTRLASTGGRGVEDESKSSPNTSGMSAAEKRATSACSLTRKPLTASSSPNLSPLHQHHHRTKLTSYNNHRTPSNRTSTTTSHANKSVLAPSGRWGGSMVASMYGGSPSTTHPPTAAHHRDPLANVHSMTTSFAVGESSGLSKNVRTKGPISPASARSQSTPRLARMTPTSTTTPGRKARQDGASDHSKTTGHGDGAPAAAGPNQKARGVSSARTPSAPPPANRRPLAAPSSEHKPPVPKAPTTPASTKAKPPAKTAPKQQQQQNQDGEQPIKIIRKPKPAAEGSTPVSPSATTVVVVTSNDETSHLCGEHAIVVGLESSPVVSNNDTFIRDETPAVDVVQIRLVEDHLDETQTDFAAHQPEFVQPEIDAEEGVVVSRERSPARDQSSPIADMVGLSMSRSTDPMSASIAMSESFNVPKPTGQGGKVLSQEEATAALAERRRLAREQMEREKELERQREEQQRLEEEEAIRREEEEFRRREEEELRELEEARRAEEERLQKMMEEENKRREEEKIHKEEENRKKTELEAKAREEAERAEKERKEAEEKFRKDELERSERKKRLEAIMQRTRQSGASPAPTSTPIAKQQQQGGSGQLFANGSDDGNNDQHQPSGQSSPPHHSASGSILAKLANSRPEMGRSLENILNRVKSQPNVNEENMGDTSSAYVGSNVGTTPSSTMATSFSADKVGGLHGANGDARMTQSFYATPVGGRFEDDGFNNYSSAASHATEYDVDGSATKSESYYATRIDTDRASLGAIPPSPFDDQHGVDTNANIGNLLISTTAGDLFDHNDNMNGAIGDGGTSNGHHGLVTSTATITTTTTTTTTVVKTTERPSASDSDTSGVTVIHNSKMVVSPHLEIGSDDSHEVSFDDPFGASPKRPVTSTTGATTFDDLINDNFSTPDVQSSSSKLVQNNAASASSERPLLDF